MGIRVSIGSVHGSLPDGTKALTHWGRVTHICVSKLSIIGSDNGLSPDRSQAIIWTNVGILLIGTLGTNFNEILIEIQTFSFKNIHLKISSGKWRPFCLGLNVLTERMLTCHHLSTVTFICGHYHEKIKIYQLKLELETIKQDWKLYSRMDVPWVIELILIFVTSYLAYCYVPLTKAHQ